jgi:hypothetical protein
MLIQRIAGYVAPFRELAARQLTPERPVAIHSRITTRQCDRGNRSCVTRMLASLLTSTGGDRLSARLAQHVPSAHLTKFGMAATALITRTFTGVR